MAFIKLDYFDWEEQFRPISKPGSDHIAFDTHYDADFIRQQPANRIWTLVDCPESNRLEPEPDFFSKSLIFPQILQNHTPFYPHSNPQESADSFGSGRDAN